MPACRFVLVPLMLAALFTPSAEAGIFFRRPPKPNPADRVAALIQTLRKDADERNRTAAAEELRNFDPKANPEIMTALTEAMQHDASPAVRTEAAQTIGRLRPISPQAGWALEQALANDSSQRVRLAARWALGQYHLYGYRNTAKPDAPVPQSGEPPLAATAPPVVEPPPAAPVATPMARPSGVPQPATGLQPPSTDAPEQPKKRWLGTLFGRGDSATPPQPPQGQPTKPTLSVNPPPTVPSMGRKASESVEPPLAKPLPTVPVAAPTASPSSSASPVFAPSPVSGPLPVPAAPTPSSSDDGPMLFVP